MFEIYSYDRYLHVWILYTFQRWGLRMTAGDGHILACPDCGHVRTCLRTYSRLKCGLDQLSKKKKKIPDRGGARAALVRTWPGRGDQSRARSLQGGCGRSKRRTRAAAGKPKVISCLFFFQRGCELLFPIVSPNLPTLLSSYLDSSFELRIICQQFTL